MKYYARIWYETGAFLFRLVR